MLSLILASSLFMGPAEEVANELGATPVEFVAHITDERLVAVNSSSRAQLLVFCDREGGRDAQTVVAAGGEVAFDFPGGTLDQLMLRVVSVTGGSAISSPAYDLAAVAGQRFEFFWMETSERQVNAWGMGPNGPAYLPATTEPTRTTQPQPSAPHVPVITPTDKPKGDLPPRIEEQPLPPV